MGPEGGRSAVEDETGLSSRSNRQQLLRAATWEAATPNFTSGRRWFSSPPKLRSVSPPALCGLGWSWMLYTLLSFNAWWTCGSEHMLNICYGKLEGFWENTTDGVVSDAKSNEREPGRQQFTDRMWTVAPEPASFTHTQQNTTEHNTTTNPKTKKVILIPPVLNSVLSVFLFLSHDVVVCKCF